MNKGITALVTLDVLNEYADTLSERIKESKSANGPMKFYIGDCLSYAFQLAQNNGWSPSTDSPDEIFEILKSVLVFCFSKCGVNRLADWSDDMNYIIVS